MASIRLSTHTHEQNILYVEPTKYALKLSVDLSVEKLHLLHPTPLYLTPPAKYVPPGASAGASDGASDGASYAWLSTLLDRVDTNILRYCHDRISQV